jgi:hypothetical protein
MNSPSIIWKSVESASELTELPAGGYLLAEIQTMDANRWGQFLFPNGMIIKVAYANLGLKPCAVLVGPRVIIGIDELLSCYDMETRRQVFCYRMPSVFHEFLIVDDPLVVRDEIGFVCITLDGHECWAHCTAGPIESFSISADRISGSTIDGDEFSFQL